MSTLSETTPEPAWLSELNPQQRHAVDHRGGPLLILAGAGTGKTTTLVARVASLIRDGADPERILLLTFTRRAAREMIGRARSLVEHARPGSGRIVGGTFHSVAHRVVRRHHAALGLPDGFGVLDASDAADLLDLVRQDGGFASGQRRFPRKHTVLDIYSRTVNAQTPLTEVLAQCFPWCAEHRDALVALFRAYGERKRALALLDLDDLLLHWRALALDAVTGPALAREHEHVLVDEYQDVNGLQVDIVRALGGCPHGPCVTAVGDDFQAIYGFRAASSQHILQFPGQFPEATVVTLEHNYRSTAPILAVANAVSAQDRAGFPKRLRTDRPGGVLPELSLPRDEAEQATVVAARVLAAREEGIDLRRQAVLFRTNHDSALLELELTRRQIPFVKYGGLRYLEAAHVKDFVALLRVSDNGADEMSWFRVLQLIDGVGPMRARRIIDHLRGASGRAAPDADLHLERWGEAREHVPATAEQDADALIAALRASREPGHTTGARAGALRDAIAPLLRLRYPDSAVRLLDLDQLVQAAQQRSDLHGLVAELVLDPPASSSDWAGAPHLDEDYLVLSTVHSAKGLEWEAVHLIAAYDGNFPADMSTGSLEGIAEERRLFYVALTRARRRLHVHAPVRYHHRPHGRDDAHGYGRLSRFLTKEVQRLCEITRPAEPEEPVPPRPQARITVSVDALLR